MTRIFYKTHGKNLWWDCIVARIFYKERYKLLLRNWDLPNTFGWDKRKISIRMWNNLKSHYIAFYAKFNFHYNYNYNYNYPLTDKMNKSFKDLQMQIHSIGVTDLKSDKEGCEGRTECQLSWTSILTKGFLFTLLNAFK